MAKLVENELIKFTERTPRPGFEPGYPDGSSSLLHNSRLLCGN